MAGLMVVLFHRDPVEWYKVVRLGIFSKLGYDCSANQSHTLLKLKGLREMVHSFRCGLQVPWKSC